MRVIVQHDEKVESYLTQYASYIEYLDANSKILNIEEKYLPWLNSIAQYVEPDFTIELGKENDIDKYFLNNKMILATIGLKAENEQVDAYYNMSTYTLESISEVKDKKACEWISCYSMNSKIDVSEYIKCIRYLKDLASRSHKPIIIYSNIYIPNETYRYRTLAYKVISSSLEKMNGVLITKTDEDDNDRYYVSSQKAFEFYLDYAIYVEDSLNDALAKVIPLLHISEDPIRLKKLYEDNRQETALFRTNVFYQAINPEQEIYVPLNTMSFREPAYYEALGIKHIPLIGNYGMLYAKRSKFDELREQLSQDVAQPYYMPIVSHQTCSKTVTGENFTHHLTAKEPKYKGKGVYIGVIATDHIDYTSEVLRTQDGKSRVACIWEQIRTDEGTYYFSEQIDEALAGSTPEQFIKLPEGDSVSTMILGIAGGESKAPEYRGIATEAEFVVAKINTAPESFQKIYGGSPAKTAVTMADILIGAIKLIDFAAEKEKPLVLCIPFNTNIDSHDGSFSLYEILALIATKESVTIIVPAGEEADKMHHYSVGGKQPALNTINIRVQRESQNIVAIAYQRFSNIVSALLYPPREVSDEAVNLKKTGVTELKGAVIYSNGYNISPLNGAIRLFFRIDNPQVGTWRIELALTTETSSQIDLWISQQELNNYVTLDPSDPLVTIGSLGNVRNIMTIGGYDESSMVVLRSSGRGYSWDNRVGPNFVTHANNITAPCQVGEWVKVTGTLSAIGVISGVAAAVYNRCIAERVDPLPNTLVMDTIILGTVKQFEGIEYPNPSYGYGVFDLKMIDSLLTAPLIL
ncbi:MAG: hypothetical protein K0S71_269 [Clostridia bacterium]|jgi:hypothetical protein|nr:hypothetical protein [Clostridia bacterium]